MAAPAGSDGSTGTHLIGAGTGSLTDLRALPWYIQAWLISEPLHVGDDGGRG